MMDELMVVFGSDAAFAATSPCDEVQFLAEVAAESIGWVPLGEEAYLHVGDPNAMVITVVGGPDATMAGVNVLWVG